MTGFILAAGYGTRLDPLTRFLPKALVPVAGKPLLARSLRYLESRGFRSIGVNSHYLSGQLEQFKAGCSVPFELFHEEKIKGTGGALHFARDFLSQDELFFVINVDIVCQIDLEPALQFFKESSFSCMLLAFPPANGTGTVLFDEKTGIYAGISKDTFDGPGLCGADFIGAAFYKREFLTILTNEDFSIIPVWSRAFEKGMKTGVFLLKSGYWRDIGTPQSLAQVHFDLISGAMDLDIPDYVTINTEKKYAVPRTLSGRQFTAIENAWVETEAIGSGSVISNSVIFKNSTIDISIPVRNSLVTPWGVIGLMEEVGSESG